VAYKYWQRNSGGIIMAKAYQWLASAKMALAATATVALKNEKRRNDVTKTSADKQ